MRPSPAVLLLALLTLPVTRAGEPDTGPAAGPPPRRVDFFAAYADDARVVRVLPLERGRLPDLTRGEEVRPGWGDAVDLDARPGVVILPDADLLVVASGAERAWIRFRRERGVWLERARGGWPAAGIVGAADLDGDGEAELVLLPARERHEPWRVLVARGRPSGAWDFDGPAQTVAAPTHAGFFALGDVTDDGRPDLLFHLQPHGADVPVHVQVAAGRDDATFAPATTLARGPAGAASLAVARLAAEDSATVVLGADDDLDDVGQAQEVVRDAQGRWLVRPGVDLEPDREGPGADEGYWILTPTDLDLDGLTDLVARWDAWYAPGGRRRTVLLVLRGTPAGFLPAERLLDREFPEDRPPSFASPPPP